MTAPFPRTLALAATVLLATGAAAPVAAQVLRGTIVDHRSKPVDSVRVTLSSTTGATVDDTLTGEDGAFAFTVPLVGDYIVRARRSGYVTIVTQPISVLSSTAATVQLRLKAAATPGDTLPEVSQQVAVEQEVPYLAQAGFYERMHRGLGRFLTRAQLDKARSDRLTDALRGMPGEQIVCNGQYCDAQAPGAASMFTRGICQQTVVLDGVVLRSGGVSGGGDPVDQLLNPFNLAGVEVYSSPSGVPVQFKGYMSPCGAIVAWSRR